MKKKKEEKLRYETVGVSRWNLCQILASVAYHSQESDQAIQEEIKAIKETWYINKK